MKSSYSDQLAALGLSPEVVARHLMANDMQKFSNRESEAYGRQDSDEERSND